jgi:hypothetical protein
MPHPIGAAALLNASYGHDAAKLWLIHPEEEGMAVSITWPKM